MIGQLRGIILEKQAPLLIIDVNGIGYEVFAPMSTFYYLPDEGESTTLFTHMVVREDAQLLYGFYQKRERSLFRSLIKVNGVGPKLALTILSGIEPDAFVQCVQQNNTTSLVSIPGIGKKTAERLIIETRDTLKDWLPIGDGTIPTSNVPTNTVEEAISALIALGYKANDARRIINKVSEPDLNSEALIRLALKQMVA